jgi:hypothetical protein
MNLHKLVDQVTETIPVIRRRQSQAIDTTRISISSNTTDKKLVPGFTQLVLDRVRAGWSCYLVTFLFNQFPGPKPIVIERMKDEMQRIYSTLLTRVHRKPKMASVDELPVLIGAVDLPVYKRKRSRHSTEGLTHRSL